MSTRLILPNIRSTYNIGAIFRTADAFGVEKIYLCGITPQPIDRFGRLQKDIAKTALGAEQSVAWEHIDNTEALMSQLKAEGVTLVGVEQDYRAIDYRSFTFPKKVALVFGAEVEGLDQNLRDLCDALIEIPMQGKKESLNVSVVTGIILSRIS